MWSQGLKEVDGTRLVLYAAGGAHSRDRGVLLIHQVVVSVSTVPRRPTGMAEFGVVNAW